MRKPTIVGAALLVMALAMTSNAGIDESDWEVALGGNFFFSDLHDNIGLSITLGYFVTAEIEIGGLVAWQNQLLEGTVDVDGGDSEDLEFQKTWWDIAFFVYYHFQVEGEWAPYVGGIFGYERASFESHVGDEDIDFDRGGLMLGGVLGMKYFISEKTAFFIEYRLIWRDDDEWQDRDVTISDDGLTHTFLFGLSVLF